MTVTAERIESTRPADVPVLFTQFEEELNKLREFLRNAPEQLRKWEEWARGIIEWLSWWTWARDTFRQAVETILTTARQAIERITQLVDEAFLPKAINDDIKVWLDVYERAKSIAENTERRDFPKMENQRKAADSYWNGRFADAYKSQVDPQHLAVEKLANAADKTANSLSKVFAVSAAVYAAYGALAYQIVMLLSFGWLKMITTGWGDMLTLGRLAGQAAAMRQLARTIGEKEAQVLSTIAGSRPGLRADDVAWPDPFRDRAFARPRIRNGIVVLEGGAAEMNR